MRLIDANLAMRKIREYMEDYPNATARLAACRACLSILGDKQQVPTMTNGDKIRRVMAQDRGSHITREQVGKMRGEWKHRFTTDDSVFCTSCKTTFRAYYDEYNFCPDCGAPMTYEAVDILWKRLEAMQDEAETD